MMCVSVTELRLRTGMGTILKVSGCKSGRYWVISIHTILGLVFKNKQTNKTGDHHESNGQV